METNNLKSSMINWWNSQSKKTKGWVIGIMVCLILAFIGYLSNPNSFYNGSSTKSKPLATNTDTNTINDVTKNDSYVDTRYDGWKSASYNGISYKIPPGFKENKKITEDGSPFIQLSNDKNRVYQFEISKNTITDYNPYETSAIPLLLTFIDDIYFENKANFTNPVKVKIGNSVFIKWSSSQPYLKSYFNRHNNDLYCIVVVSDDITEAEMFVESVSVK